MKLFNPGITELLEETFLGKGFDVDEDICSLNSYAIQKSDMVAYTCSV
jgi:hypothetical protein